VLGIGLACLIALSSLWSGGPALAQALDLERLENEAVTRLRSYLQIDTTNPPGNEVRAAEFFAEILSAEGIPFERVESAPGRGNIWARLEGGSEPALVLLHHTDVVPADERFWDVPPFSGRLEQGSIYGRGAIDDKTLGILHLQTFLALHRLGLPLDRDVIFMATADEEAGGVYGAGWLVEHRPEIFEGVGLLLNEGGGGTEQGGRRICRIEVTQKVPMWVRLVARGRPGHGSAPRGESAVTRLVRALTNIHAQPFEPRVVPAVDAYFKGLSRLQTGDRRALFADVGSAITDPEVMAQLQFDEPALHALVRNTCSITRLQGSDKINVIPPEASAELDCRLLPDQDPDEFLLDLRRVIDDPSIDVEKILSFSPAVSTTDTELYRAIAEVCDSYLADATVLPAVSAGFTDSHYFRDIGIVSYGFAPLLIPASDRAAVHGNNERISVENVKRGVRMNLEIVRRLVHEAPAAPD
jgi:acetylornithine deacetylase/succinyl-diaminopimelate desuccinylase-like protein